MKKIISLFQRNYDGNRLVRNEIVPGAEWVANGEGFPTRKYDGTCCLIQDGKLLKRYDAKKGKVPPQDFIPAQSPDPTTGHWPGWVLVTGQDKWHLEAWRIMPDSDKVNGTYELCGPKVQGNPEGLEMHFLIKHGTTILGETGRTFEQIKEFLLINKMEGIVWHHPDGLMVKIKAKDFGIVYKHTNER